MNCQADSWSRSRVAKELPSLTATVQHRPSWTGRSPQPYRWSWRSRPSPPLLLLPPLPGLNTRPLFSTSPLFLPLTKEGCGDAKKKIKGAHILTFLDALCKKTVVLVITCFITAAVHRTQHRLRLPAASLQPQALVCTQSSVGSKFIICDWRGSCLGAITEAWEIMSMKIILFYFNISALEANVGHLDVHGLWM